ncbi:MAG: hypothetical protein WC676_01820 [Candidatus Omnitrophota bacterium]
MRKKILFISVLAILFSPPIIPNSVFAQATETITLTTYYPAPFGAYDRLQIMPHNPAAPLPTCDGSTLGLMFFNDATDMIVSCQGTTPAWVNLGSGFWTTGAIPGNIYTTDINYNVGIGTTNPTSRLSVLGGSVQWGAATTSNSLNADGGGSIELGASSNTTLNPVINGAPYIDFHSGWLAAPQDFNMRIINSTNNRLEFQKMTSGVTTSVMTINGVNVGIKNSSPAYDLSIVDSGVGLGRPVLNQLAFYTNSAERMRVDASGNVGIGIANPAGYKLNIGGGANGAAPVPRLKLSDYYDNAGNPSLSHIDLYGGAYGFGISSNSLNYISNQYHRFYDAGDLVTPVLMMNGDTKRVGINVAVPAGTIDFQGGTAAANQNGVSMILRAQDGGTGNTDGGHIILNPGSGSGTGQPGTIWIQGGSIAVDFQKLCRTTDGGNFTETVSVPAGWPKGACEEYSDEMNAGATLFSLGCLFSASGPSGYISWGPNCNNAGSCAAPSPNCGW